MRTTQQINKHIALHIRKPELDVPSHCVISGEKDVYTYHFHLSCADCLFDLEDCNYEIVFQIHAAYFEKYEALQPIATDTQHNLCSNSQTKLVEILKGDKAGPMANILIESNLLYLIYKMDSSYQKSLPDCESCSFLNKPMEREKIIAAKNYILKNLSESLTIPIVAMQVGTNQCYLKKGFKEVYDKTIYEFVLEHRMVKAQHLLQENKLSIADIALEIGYATVSSFSQAYKNYFGISPSVHKAGAQKSVVF